MMWISVSSKKKKSWVHIKMTNNQSWTAIQDSCKHGCKISCGPLINELGWVHLWWRLLEAWGGGFFC